VTRPVLVVADQLGRRVPGGIGTYAIGLLQGLGATKNDSLEISVLARRLRRTPAGWGGPDRVVPAGLALRTSIIPPRVRTVAWDLGLLTVPTRYGIVHAVSTAAPPTREPSALVVTVHDLAWRRYPDTTTARGRRWHEGALQRALRRARAFVVPSQLVAGDLVAAGASHETVWVIPEGSDHLASPDDEGAGQLLERLGVDGPYLLSVSTLEPRKNLRRLAAAYALARPRLPEPWPLVVVGPGGWGDPRLGVDLAGSEGVVLAGAVPPGVLSSLYRGARSFLYVPLTEGYGLPPLEAMRCGAPVVASAAVPSVQEGRTDPPAILVDPLDVASIADGIVCVSTDENRRVSLVERGQALAAERTWAAAARCHLELWKSLG